jgi:hypothetical protein
MRRFYLYRSVDVTVVSGTGVIAEGIEFTNGWVVLRWISSTPSVIFYTDVADMLKVHGHHGLTTIQWVDRETKTDSVKRYKNHDRGRETVL